MIDILYEHGPCLVVNKPAGVLTQAPPGIDSLEIRIRRFLADRDGEAAGAYLGVVHRLDRPATGAIVFGLTRKAAWKLSRQFEQRWVRKIYWACVEGAVEPAAGAWTDRMRKVPDESRAEIHPEGQEAVLRYEIRARGPWGTCLEITLETGRTHQIRVQAASRGHPVLGDRQYGAAGTFGPSFADERLLAIALHARSLSFRDPTTREDVTVVAPLPAPWEEMGISAA